MQTHVDSKRHSRRSYVLYTKTAAVKSALLVPCCPSAPVALQLEDVDSAYSPSYYRQKWFSRLLD